MVPLFPEEEELLQIEEGEKRLEYGVHYGIPYPRLHHAQQFSRRYILDAPAADLEGDISLPQCALSQH